MSQDFEKLLLAVGLLPSEVKVYLSALEMGPSSVQNLAKKAKISRTATYEAVEALQKRGLVSSSVVGKKSVFSAEDPERIVSYLDAERQRFERTKEDVERSMDELRLLIGGARPSVRVYEGEVALKGFFEHVAHIQPKEYCEISNVDDVYNLFDVETLKAARKASPWPKMEYRGLYHGTLRNPREGFEFRKLESAYGSFHGTMAVYGDFLSLVTFSSKIVVVIIESSMLADSMRVIFENLWEKSSK